MTTYNRKKSIFEKGGMMIEALAMLGLIAVVTPTMYKKSAERTLEVEDINTATKIRTYMNAVDSMLTTNYTSIINDLAEHNKTQKTFQLSDLRAFLPYGYASTNALYDYGDPAISVVRDGNNLTGFLLFPANESEADGIGRERTARIASLIGANGGYVRASKDARGVGGVWALEGTTYDKVFPSSGGANVNSIVVSTANPINNASQGEMDNDKYLQRTYDGKEDIWRNTMRTDLYLGGYNEGDTHDDQGNQGDLHSIRNVNNLIIGAEKVCDGCLTEEGNSKIYDDQGYGLYIADGTNKSAYISGDTNVVGALKAAAEKFMVTEEKLAYGDSYSNFEVTNSGDLTQYGNVSLAEGFMSSSGRSVKIGGNNGDAYVLDAVHDGVSTSVRLLKDNYFSITKNSSGEFLEMMGGVYNKLKNGGSETTMAEPSYNTPQTYPVRIGSNTRVNGLLTANQIDTNTIRSTSLKTGSQHIDDATQWLNVDDDGIKMYSRDRTDGLSKVAVDVNNDGLAVRAGGLSDEDTTAAVLKVQNADNSQVGSQIRASADTIRLKANNNDGDVTLMNNNLAQVVKKNEVVFGSRATFTDMGFADDSISDYRVVFGKNGNVDLIDSNFHVSKTEGDKIYNVLSIAGNKREEGGFDGRISDSFSDALVNGAYAPYDMAVHGNAVFTSRQENRDNSDNADYNYMSIGRASTASGVSIAASGDDQSRQVLFIDLKSYHPQNNAAYDSDPVIGDELAYPETGDKPTLTAGSVYIRKGMVDVMPEKPIGDDNAYGGAATNGYGVIKASRFVANNVDSNGNYIKVKQILKADTYNQYNGSNRNRYDTYMVNPAYTSVMHDIKLTTRGGARLSDVLPDFITKGIYIATNDYDDNLNDFTFTMNNSASDMRDVKVGGKNPTRGEIKWASPYTGSLPAPQCPPGYSRVITVNPVSIQMAEAGKIKYAGRTDDDKSANWVVDDAGMRSGAEFYRNEDEEAVKKRAPEYTRLHVEADPYKVSRLNEGYSDQYEISNVKGLMVSADNYSDRASVLASRDPDGGGITPLTFQQNTHLKSLAVPVCAGGESSQISSECSNYTRGWAILLGFVYDKAWVEAFSNITLAPGENGYWNLFPIKKRTLEASVSTYCYFNRANLDNLGEPFIDTYSEYVDPYHPVKRATPASYEKKAGRDYLKRLNDPALKYNEVW